MKTTRESWDSGLTPLTPPALTVSWVVFCCLASGTLAALISVHRPLWLDEFYMLITVRRPFMEGLLQLEDYSAPLYQLILRLFVHSDAPSKILVRLPAILSAVLGLLAIWWLSRALFNARVAALTIFVVAFNPCFLDHATEARPYTLFLLLSVLSFGTFYKCLTCRSRYFLAAYVGSSVLLVYSHYFGLLALPAQALTLLAYGISARQPAVIKRIGYAFGAVVFLSIPALWLISRCVSSGLLPVGNGFKTPLAALFFLDCGPNFFADRTLGVFCVWPLLVMALEVFGNPRLGAFVDSGMEDPKMQRRDVSYLPALLCFAWIGFSWYLLLIVTCLFKSGYAYRYAFPVLVPFALVLSAVSVGMRRTVQLLIVMIIIFSYTSSIKDQIKYASTDYPDLAAQLRTVNEPGAKVWITDWSSVNDIEPVQYGLHYYGYAGAGASSLRLSKRPDVFGFEIQQPELLQNDQHFYVVTRMSEYEKCVDDYLGRSSRQYSKMRFGSLTLFNVNNPPGPR